MLRIDIRILQRCIEFRMCSVAAMSHPMLRVFRLLLSSPPEIGHDVYNSDWGSQLCRGDDKHSLYRADLSLGGCREVLEVRNRTEEKGFGPRLERKKGEIRIAIVRVHTCFYTKSPDADMQPDDGDNVRNPALCGVRERKQALSSIPSPGYDCRNKFSLCLPSSSQPRRPLKVHRYIGV